MKNDACCIREILEHGYRFALALTHNREHADDLVQEVISRFLRNERSLSRWTILRAIKNLFIDEIRKSSGLPVSMPLDEIGGDSPQARVDADWNKPLHLANGALASALAHIRPEERGVIFLWAVEEMSAREIADLLEWPRSTVLSMLQRGRSKLRENLEIDSTR